MILTDIKKYLSEKSGATAVEIAIALKTDKELVIQAMEHWIRKEMVIRENLTLPCKGCSCGSSVSGASCCFTSIYRWVA